MAAYSGTPLPKKLGIKPGHRVALLGAPDGFPARALSDLPEGVDLRHDFRTRADFDVIMLFSDRLSGLKRRLGAADARLDPDGGIWIAWPKKASGVPTDVDEGHVRRIGLESGLVDNKICAVDEIWSGLRFVVRVVDRPARRSAASQG